MTIPESNLARTRLLLRLVTPGIESKLLKELNAAADADELMRLIDGAVEWAREDLFLIRI